MGNSIPLLSTEPLDARSCIQKLPGSKIVQQEVLCDRRFMKSFRSKRDNENLVVKVYYTGDANESDLAEAEAMLLEQRDKFSKNSNAFNVIPCVCRARSRDAHRGVSCVLSLQLAWRCTR